MSVDSAIERILELSAEAQIRRRETAAEDSPAFHNLTEAIVAYGKALGLLSKLKEVQTARCSSN
jgi:CRISPR/Cas system CSM-associated protein Csm2 small subunit